MKLGDKVTRMPVTFGDWQEVDRGERKGKEKRAMTGKVVYIHPQGRYHTVEFQTAGGPIRESFPGI